jgi:hypothetical protein
MISVLDDKSLKYELYVFLKLAAKRKDKAVLFIDLQAHPDLLLLSASCQQRMEDLLGLLKCLYNTINEQDDYPKGTR